MTSAPRVSRIRRFSLTVGDADALGQFYQRALGFERIGEEQRGGPGFAALMGLGEEGDAARARVIVLRLGAQEVELVAFAHPGAPIPRDAASNDLAFQHFAIVVADMAAAYARLAAMPGWSAISRDGPRHLPARSGGVTAFKFRDPEGHPLELLSFPTAATPPAWRQPTSGDPCLGIDHSAVVVADTATSVRFYTDGLGFSVATQTLNEGKEQAHLDNVPAPRVEVTALSPQGADCPHVELLCYRAPAPGRLPAQPKCSNDLRATRLIVETTDVATLVRRLAGFGGLIVSTATPGRVEGGQAILARDPDGHDLLINQAA